MCRCRAFQLQLLPESLVSLLLLLDLSFEFNVVHGMLLLPLPLRALDAAMEGTALMMLQEAHRQVTK